MYFFYIDLFLPCWDFNQKKNMFKNAYTVLYTFKISKFQLLVDLNKKQHPGFRSLECLGQLSGSEWG